MSSNNNNNTTLPIGWTSKQSSSHPGKDYYINSYTGETTWTKPTEPALKNKIEEVQVLHILKKHNQSRRPSSWRCAVVTQTIEDATMQVLGIRGKLVHILNEQGFKAMFQAFQSIAYEESDCGSHERGGDLGLFGRGQMQKAFEEVSFSLQVQEISDIVATDSGIHIILRIQ